MSSRESNNAASTVVEGTWRGGYDLESEELPVGNKDAEGLAPGVEYRNQQKVGAVEVYFGCRHEDHDWLYREEMKQCETDGTITNLYNAFSRDTSRKAYVQDLMKQTRNAQRLVDILVEQKGAVYICGDGNSMAKDVQGALVDILGRNADGIPDKEGGRAQLDKLKKEGRFLMDIWS